MATNKTYYQGDLRCDLLEAAVLVIEEKGIGALSLREVARRVGVSHAAPAHHFGGKSGLFTAIATDSFHLIADEMRRVDKASGPDPLDRLDACGEVYIKFAIENRARFEVMFRPEVLMRSDADYNSAATLTHAHLSEIVEDARSGGWAKGRQPDALVLGTWALVHGLATLLNQGNLPGLTSPAEQVQAAIAAMEAMASARLGPSVI